MNNFQVRWLAVLQDKLTPVTVKLQGSGADVVHYQYYFSPGNQASKFAPQPWPSRLAKFLGLVTDDVETGILTSEVSCLCKFCINSVLLGYRCLVQIPHDFLPLRNHCFYS